ncbi:Bbp16 family capsid cement protein [Bradyrhizobium sp. HKCCYLS2038]|uniref:Bbp16 family capsid cement protein n=1 Tax=Bradyrhizobium sp. HKCCYLS2038 TaxID=3420764 RepID=UPI003EB6E8DF
MIFDLQTLLSNAQAITASAASTNIIDLGPIAPGGIVRDIGKGREVPLRIQVVEAFNNLTSLTIDIQTDDNTGFSSPATVISRTIPLAQLTAGYVDVIEEFTRKTNERYVRLNYTVTGTAPTTGKITAGVTMGNQSNAE